MGRWIDRMSSGERAELRDAGRIGNSRFETEAVYARHIANPQLSLLVVERFGTTRALLKYPGEKQWASADLMWKEGICYAVAVNAYESESEARSNAEEYADGSPRDGR